MLREEAEREAEEKAADEAEYAGLVKEYEDLSKISLEVFLEVSEEDLRVEFRRLNMKLAHKLAFFVLYRKARGGVSSSAPAAIVSETSQNSGGSGVAGCGVASQPLGGVYPTAHHLREAVSAWVVARLGSGPGAMSGINLQMEKRKGKVGELVLRCQRAGHPKKK